jgi:hypothetical protein
MSERQPLPYDSVARKWLALAERRHAHILELSDTGRWRHYFTLAELAIELNKAEALRDEWARIAGVEAGFEDVPLGFEEARADFQDAAE